MAQATTVKQPGVRFRSPRRSTLIDVQAAVEITNVTYDARGRLTQQNWIVPGSGGGTFRLDHTYNAADQATTLRYPGGTAGQQGELMTTGYNALGQLNSVSGSGVSYVSSTTYNATSTGAQCGAVAKSPSSGWTRAAMD